MATGDEGCDLTEAAVEEAVQKRGPVLGVDPIAETVYKGAI
jgi:hypothetical protein